MQDFNYHIHYVGFSHPDKDRSILKDAMGRYRTNLFHEFNIQNQEDYPPLYTMRENPWLGLPSAYQIYMYSDSEHTAAMKLVGSWAHWKRLLASPSFMKGPDTGYQWTGLEGWRLEKRLREEALAYTQLKEAAENGNVQAQKLIYEGRAAKRGRPSKEEIQRAAKEAADCTRELKEDLGRLKLVVNGNTSGSN